MTINLKILVCILLIGLLSSATFAQKRKSQRSTQRNNNVETNVEISTGAEKVSIQIVNLARFIYVLGGVAKGIEEIDEQARKGKIDNSLIEKNQEFKRKTIQSIRDLRAGLAALEVEFRTKQSLKPYLEKISGITDESAMAEDQAIAGKFVEAGRTLLLIIEKLSSTLAAMSSRQ
jgi:hypothetical protein